MSESILYLLQSVEDMKAKLSKSSLDKKHSDDSDDDSGSEVSDSLEDSIADVAREAYEPVKKFKQEVEKLCKQDVKRTKDSLLRLVNYYRARDQCAIDVLAQIVSTKIDSEEENNKNYNLISFLDDLIKADAPFPVF